MTFPLSRRAVLSAASLLGLAPIAYGRGLQPEPPAPPADAFDSFPRQRPDLVREMVGASHSNLPRVRELITQHKGLAKAAWDWGFGDWETALGAASHVGNREIAAFLIENGARPDVFTFTMLGDLASVKAMIEAQPGLQRLKGPHSIPLLAHARAGGDAAKAVYNYLESLPGAGDLPTSEPMTEEELIRLTGTFQGTGAASGVQFEIRKDKANMVFQRRPHPPSRLFYLGKGEFCPTGATHVRMTFESGINAPARVIIRDHDIILTALAVP